MALVLFLLLFAVPEVLESLESPLGAGSGTDRRPLDCEPVSLAGARRQMPGHLEEESARGDYFDRRAVLCRERFMSTGIEKSLDEAGKAVRPPRDDAVLMQLSATAAEFARLVGELAPDTQQRTWLVEAYYPNPAVSQKVRFAVKNSLAERGLAVSDRVPLLSAGDIEVIAQTKPRVAYQIACHRYRVTQSMGATDALLAIVSRDSRETVLHAGVCLDGRFRWLQ